MTPKVTATPLTGGKAPVTPKATRPQVSTPKIKFVDSTPSKIGDTYIKDSLKITPNVHANGGKIDVSYSDGGRTMNISFSGTGWNINADTIREQIIKREYSFGGSQTFNKPKPVPPEKIVITINGSYNRFHGSPVQADVAVNGDHNIIQTGDNNDNVTINGFSNIAATQGGDDNVTITKGSGNSVYLGNGDDNFSAPKKSFANYAFSGEFGHDKTEGGIYIKNKDLGKNNFNITLARAKQKVSDAGSAIADGAKEAYGVAKDTASLVGQGVSKIPDALEWYGNGGISKEGLKKLDESIQEIKIEKLKENCGKDILSGLE